MARVSTTNETILKLLIDNLIVWKSRLSLNRRIYGMTDEFLIVVINEQVKRIVIFILV